MHLDEISCNEFFDAMDSLLYFTNKRFDVVEDYRFEITTQLDEESWFGFPHSLGK